MPKVSIFMPQLGESIAEATVLRLRIQVGDTVQADQEIIEVETNKAIMDVTTVCGGVVLEIFAQEGKPYAVGAVLGILEVDEEEIKRTGADIWKEEPTSSSEPSLHSPTESNVHFAVSADDCYEEGGLIQPNIKGLPVPVGGKGAHYLSPRLRARMNDLGLREADISAIAGTGQGGRVTVADLELFLEYLSSWPSVQTSPMRRAVADAMRRSWARPLATVGRPLVLDKVLSYRSSLAQKPGLTLFLLRAFALALKAQPEAAGYLIGEKIIHPRAFDIGIAVQVEDGVMVPVLRQVDQKTLDELREEYERLIESARQRRLSLEDTKGGIASVTNFGTFGLTFGTPIPLPNETLILGLGAGVKKPSWSDPHGAFLPITEAELVLTFDHRVIDGGGAGLLLNHICELLQNPEAL
jgi:pyruvate/2-oxoglutarate dehydrogenase complex dihydrolipoamide acyltransferase (E2) component